LKVTSTTPAKATRMPAARRHWIFSFRKTAERMAMSTTLLETSTAFIEAGIRASALKVRIWYAANPNTPRPTEPAMSLPLIFEMSGSLRAAAR
jgi:hypothetical protein